MHRSSLLTLALAATCLFPPAPARAASAPTGNMSAVWMQDYSFYQATLSGSAMDAEGNTYVAGSVRNLEKDDDDFLTIKLDPSGAVLWSRTYDHGGVEAWDWGCSVGVDAVGNVYVFGESWNGTDDDLELIKYDRDGNLLWARIYDSGGADDRASAAAVDAAGNVYAASAVYDFESMENQIDAVTQKWDADGNLVWQQVHETGIHEWATSVAVGGDGSVTVGAYAWAQDGSASTTSVLRYSREGALLWTHAIPDALGWWSMLVAADVAGNSFCIGEVSNGTNNDVLAEKLDASGNLLWARSFDTGASEGASGVTVDAAGNLLVAANVTDNAGAHAVTLRYGPTGKLDGSEEWYGASGFRVAADPQGSAFTLFNSGAWPDSIMRAIRYQQVELRISKSALPAASLDVPFTHTPKATGGVEPYRWAVIGDSLPDGLMLDPSTGRISGTPTKVQRRTFALEVTDSAGTRVIAGADCVVSYPLSIVSELPPAVMGSPYAGWMAAEGGGVYRAWNVTAGSLPPGLTLSADGYVSGIPEAIGTFDVTLTVVDERGLTASRNYSVLVDWLDLQPAVLMDAVLGQPYGQQLVTSRGSAPFAWDLAGGALPAGVALDATTGFIAGVPMAAGSFEFDVRAVDAGGLDGTRRRRIDVNDLVEAWRTTAGEWGNSLFGAALDGQGHLHVGGLRWTGSAYEVLLQERDSTGVVLSERAWAPGTASYWSPVLGVGADGSVGVVGGFWDGTRYGLLAVVFGPDGAERFTRVIESTGNCWAGGIALAPSGEIYVAGGVEEMVDGRNQAQLKVVALDGAGIVRWTQETPGFWTSQGAIALDSLGALYVGGSTTDRDGTYALLAKYDRDGTLHWSRTFGRGGINWVWYSHLAVAPDGDVVAAGVVYSSNYDVMISRYSPTGDLRWHTTPGRGIGVGYANGLAVDGEGNAFLACDPNWQWQPAQVLTKFDPAGNRLWSKATVTDRSSITMDASGRAYLAGGSVVAAFEPAVP